MQGFLDLKWAKWKRVLLTRSVAMVPCVIIAILAVNILDVLSDYINVEQSLLVRAAVTGVHGLTCYIIMAIACVPPTHSHLPIYTPPHTLRS